MQKANNLNYRFRRIPGWLTLSVLGCTGAIVPFLSQPAIAQIDPAGSLGGGSSLERGLDADSDQGMNQMFDMFHRIQQGSIRSMSEFSQDQRDSIGEAANDFRKRQADLFQQSNQPSNALDTLSPVAPATQPAQPQNN